METSIATFAETFVDELPVRFRFEATIVTLANLSAAGIGTFGYFSSTIETTIGTSDVFAAVITTKISSLNSSS